MAKKRTIYIGSDHAGYGLKEELKKYLGKLGVAVEDLGNTKLEPLDDYPDYALKVARKVAQTKGEGLLICGSGVGMCMAANKVRGVRAVNAYSQELARASRQHNQANVLCFGQGFIKPAEAKKITKAWLNTPYSDEPRHVRRVQKINRL
ncbi:MAG: ribose 5-phosphate isomerase B [Candidatus Komeilibacteria bacterium]|nr:ribose 5-phosphate isomerase B [Candidatus Komeilibacteria bacterium]